MNNLTKYYQSHTESYGMPPRRSNQIISLLTDLKESKVLDVGCGDGSFGKLLEKKGAEVTGIDIATQAVKIAKKNLSHSMVVDLNLESLPFKAGTFDAVVASEVLEHLFDPQKLLREIKKVLKPDGMVILTTPNFLYWGHRIKFLKGEFEYQNSGPFDRGHIHFYTYGTLLKDLNSSGFEVIEEKHIFLGSPIVKFIESFFPSLFAYQFIIKCGKK